MHTMSGYTKLFSSILASTIWREDMETRIVWITLLAMAGKDGVAEASVPGLADFARVSVEGTRRALVKLTSPDPDSRTEDHAGRRIQAVDGWWLLLNHAKYRAKLSDIERREYKRMKQAGYRRKKPSAVDTVLTTVEQSGQCSPNVDTVDTMQKQKQTQKQTYTHTAPLGARSEHRSHAVCGRVCLPAFLFNEFIRLKGGAEDTARAYVDAWALGIIRAWGEDGSHAADSPGADALKFWRQQWDAAHPSARPEPGATSVAELVADARKILNAGRRAAS